MKKKLSLTAKILISMALGIIIGIIISYLPKDSLISTYLTYGLFDVVGKIFIKCLKMLVVPLVFISLVCGTYALKDIKKLGRLGIKTFILYLFTTSLAISLALGVSNIINPGLGFNLPTITNYVPKTSPSFSNVIINIFPSNPLKAMVEGNMLQVIFFAILVGLAIATLGNKVKKIEELFEDLNTIMMKLISMLIEIAPYGVFCLISNVFADKGLSAIKPISKYFFLVVIVLLLQAFITYPLLLKLLSGLNPIIFFRKIKDIFLFAFTTASSNATIPITLETVEKDLGVHNSIASFTIQLGATINMDGTAIMQGCATVFIAQAYLIDISFNGYLAIILTATLASIGTAGVPGVGLITLAMVLKQVGLPEEGIGLIIGVDRLLDMTRTAINVMGDAIVSCIVAKSEGELNKNIFNKIK